MRLTQTALFALGTFLLLPACKDQKPQAGSAGQTNTASKKILQFGNGDEPQGLDPHIVSGTIEHKLFLALFEGLVAQGPNGGPPQGGVAEDWKISEDRLTYTFFLRENARWSNGEPVTAQDFARSYERMLTPGLGAQYAYMLYVLEGAEAFNQGKLTDFSKVGVKAIDARTLQLKLRQPTPFLLSAMLHYVWYPVHLPTIEKFGKQTDRASSWTRVGNFVGNGPYRLKDWKVGQRIVVERSPTYWDRDAVKLDEINFHAVTNTDTEERMFRQGLLHVTLQVPLSKLDVYRRENPQALHIDPWAGTYFYWINTSRRPLNDVRVRRALSLAVDRESLVRNVTLSGEKAAYSLVPPDIPGYVSRHHITENIAEAKRLLAEAGFPEGRGFPRLTVNYNTNDKHRAICEALQQMWRKNLGIDIGLENQEWRVYMATQNAGDFDIQRGGWLADYIDPHAFFEVFQGNAGNNHTHWKNAKYDELFAAALDAKTTEERFEMYQEMEKLLLDEQPILLLYFYNYDRLISPKTNYRTTLLDDFPFKYVELKD